MINEDLKYIADYYGLEGQTKKCKEELNELIEALGGNCDIHLAEEIADVEIMISQIKYLRNIPDEQVDVIMQYKIQRQLRRIENEGGESLADKLEAFRVRVENAVGSLHVSPGEGNDEIESPSHYKLDGLDIEAIDVIKAVLGKDGFKAHCRGCALKYLLRADKKNRIEDLKKARVYLNWEIEYGCDN